MPDLFLMKDGVLTRYVDPNDPNHPNDYDHPDQYWIQAVHIDGEVTIDPGDVEIGAVELKNATDDTRARIGALTGSASSDNGLSITDPIANAVLGTTAGAKVITDANGTLQQFLRGLIYLLITTGAALVTPTGNVAGGAADSGNPVKVGGKYNSSAPTLDNADRGDLELDVNGNLKTREQYAPVYEDNTNGKAVVEHRYTQGRVTADGQIKGSAGFIHSVSIAGLTATPTAGLLTVYDSLTETGTVIYSEWIFATVVGHTIILDVPCATGIYVGFDATLANVQVQVSYR